MDTDGITWPSPWGEGRPGWHIECSAMSIKYLGEEFDIHGGGLDLKFPHHENEIAQAECATERNFASLWMHTGPLRIEDKKMSKSLKNFITVKDILKDFHPEVLRLFFLLTHYRSPISYSKEGLENAKRVLDKFYTLFSDIKTTRKFNEDKTFREEFISAFQDDFNSPKALSLLQAYAANTESGGDLSSDKLFTIKVLLNSLGLLLDEAENERMHLMFFIEIAQPNWFERALVLIAQITFMIYYFILYIISYRLAHKMIAYFEEEAVKSYTDYLERVESGELENFQAPILAIQYYGLDRNAKLSDLIRAVREDEQKHSKVNHSYADQNNN